MSRTTKQPEITEKAALGVQEKRLEMPNSDGFVTDWAMPSQDFTYTQVLPDERVEQSRTERHSANINA